MCFVLCICCISCEGVLASYSPLDRQTAQIILVKHELLPLMASGRLPKSWLFTDIALVNFSASLGSGWCHSTWAGKGRRQLQQPRDFSIRRGLPKGPPTSRAGCLQWQKPEQGAGCLLWVRNNPGYTYSILAPVFITPCLQLSVLKQPRAFSKGERIYNSVGKITNITAVP